MPRKGARVSQRQAHLLFFRVIPALVAAAALVGASLAGWAFLASSSIFAGSLTGCTNGDSGLPYTPITGVEIDASQLVAGRGCGTGAGQIYKYAALLTYDDEAGPESFAAYSGVFDCFTNGIFSNLQPDDAGSTSFLLQVYAFNQASYPAALDNLAVAYDAGAVEDLTASANWTTTCTASQSSGVTVVALCQPLQPVGGSPEAEAGATDAGTGDADAGAGGADGGTGDAEAGAGEADGGASDADASAGDADAGASDADASAGDADAGASDADASAGDADAGASDAESGS